MTLNEVTQAGVKKVAAVAIDSSGDVVVPVLVASGTRRQIVLDPNNADAANVANERYSSATGCVAFRLLPLPNSVALVKALIFGWSTTEADLVAVNLNMAAISAEITTPSGASELVARTGVLAPVIIGATNTGWVGDTEWQLWDGDQTIKTIAVRSSGADYTSGVVLEVLE